MILLNILFIYLQKGNGLTQEHTEQMFDNKDTSIKHKNRDLEQTLDDRDTLENFGEIEENYETIYPLNEIRIEKKSYTLFELKRQYEDRQELQLDPDFQRESVWKRERQSELIESILMKIPIPVFYFFRTSKGMVQVVDGRQRIDTVISFMNNEFELSPLSIIRDIKGKKFNDLTPTQQRAIEDYSIDVYLIQPPTPECAVLDIFDRVNRGGITLNKQEMRNAIYQGNSTKLLKTLSEIPEFKEIAGNFIDTKRMKDRYIILRFIAFYLYFTYGELEYKGRIDSFLADTMKIINKMDEAQINEITQIFAQTMQYIQKHYDKDIFRFPSQTRNKRPINMLLFESLCYLIVECQKKEIKISQEKIDKLKKHFEQSGKFSKAVDSVPSVTYRFQEVSQQIIKEN